ncbi:MAG TPA: MurR/RpiR family transcriptional regulator [Chloroflexi bacterium]|nr:MurR/RpiR family transcriptional regulator [Chloroflexota bacterium]
MFRERIQDIYEQLSPRFRTLADFILEDTLDVGFLTATELARRVGVDPATVVRFSQELGYSGYRELSREIKQYINQELALRYQKGAPEAEGLEGEIALRLDELSDRVLSLKADSALIGDIAEQLDQAARVFVISKTEGHGLAMLWVTYLTIIGIEAHAVQADMGKSALTLRDIHPDDVLFAISLGLDPDIEIGHMLSAAREQGLNTIALTTSPTLLPARQSALTLTAPAKTPSGYPFFDSLVAALSAIWQALIVLNSERAAKGVANTMQALDVLAQQQDKVPPYDIAALQRLWKQA